VNAGTARATDFEHVRSLTSAAAAAELTDHPSSLTRKTIRSRCLSDDAALLRRAAGGEVLRLQEQAAVGRLVTAPHQRLQLGAALEGSPSAP
jgi:hypothetical protein